MKSERLIERAASLVARGSEMLGTRRPPPENVIGDDRVDSAAFYEWKAAGRSFLHFVFGEKHPHSQTSEKEVTYPVYSDALQGVGILRAAHEELAEGFVGRLQELVAAEVFTDFLEMARHLLESGYKDAAASLCGAVLEDGLRRIARAHSVSPRPVTTSAR